tara:strand:- start:2341 stop:2511 length:171 start_codon:yes stop_codon:yes gene_type:complete
MDEETLKTAHEALADKKQKMAFYKRLQLRLLDSKESDMFLRDEVMQLIKDEYDRTD